MSSIRQEQAAMHKKQLKEAEERRINGNKPIINENANIDIDKIAKEADKQADEILAKVVEESKPKTKKVTKVTFEKFIKKYRPSVGDIVMSRVGSYGISSFVETHEPFCMGQNTVVIHPKHINGRFLYECLNSKLIQKQIELEVAGSGYKSISLADIRALTIPIPPKKEQEVIQSTLLSIDDQTICQKQKLTQTQSLKKSLMQVLLTGKVRVKVN